MVYASGNDTSAAMTTFIFAAVAVGMLQASIFPSFLQPLFLRTPSPLFLLFRSSFFHFLLDPSL